MASPQPGVWGIDLGQCGVKALRLEEIDGELTATAFDYIEYPKILTQPDADPDQLTRDALEQFLSRNSIRGDMVVISVPGQSGLARFVKLPPVEERKIADIVRFEAKQQIPFPLDEVVWDFQKLGTGEVTDGFAMGTEIGLFALKRDMVFRYLQHFKDVNVEVHVVQMAPLALCNFIAFDLIAKDKGKDDEDEDEKPIKSDKKQCVVALDIGTDNSNLVITDGDRIIWQRPIPLGGNHFTRALTKDMKLTFAKAEHLKRNAARSPELKKILSSLKTVLNDFVGEVQRSLGYFTNTHRDAEVQYMIGLGNAFRLPGLQKYLQEKLQLEVRKFGGLARVEGEEVMSAPTFVENLSTFAVAYGLALQGLKKTRLSTNLLPYDVHLERLVRSKKPWAITAAACLILAIAGLTFARSMEKAQVFGVAVDQVLDAEKKVTVEKNDLIAKHNDELAKLHVSQEDMHRLAAGVDERWNWQLLNMYLNYALPSPDGKRVPVETDEHFFGRDPSKGGYVNRASASAFAKQEERRFDPTLKTTSPEELKKLDAEIKQNLIQVTVEAIDARYYEDLSGFYRAIRPKPSAFVKGMKIGEIKMLADCLKFLDGSPPKTLREFAEKNDIPTWGWVVEVRGYTYHRAGWKFVQNTFLENLNHNYDRVGVVDADAKVPGKDNKMPAKDEKVPDKNAKAPGKGDKTPVKDVKPPEKDAKDPGKDDKTPVKDAKPSEKDAKAAEDLAQVEITIDKKEVYDRLKKDDVFDVYRPSPDGRNARSEFLGTVTVTEITDKGCIASHHPNSRKMELKKGDVVAQGFVPENKPLLDKVFLKSYQLYDGTVVPEVTLREAMYERVTKRVSFLWIYDTKKVVDPKKGVFELINVSEFNRGLKNAGAVAKAAGPGPRHMPMPLPPGKPPPPAAPAGPVLKDRKDWVPLGFQPPAPGKGPFESIGTPRVEFVLLFVWQEPFLDAPK